MRYASDSALVCTREKRRYLPGREDHDVCFEFRPIRELESFLSEALDGAPVLELNIAIDDVFACAGICQRCEDAVSFIICERLANIVSSRTREQKLEDACPV
jgi:hypothetical protein